MILRHPMIMKHINPNFYTDMMKVFHRERTSEDSLRYINKIKNLEDTSIMTPTTERKVLEQLFYELSKMKQMYYILKLKRSFEDIKKVIDITPFLNNKSSGKNESPLNLGKLRVKTLDSLLKRKFKEKIGSHNSILNKVKQTNNVRNQSNKDKSKSKIKNEKK